MPRLPNPPVAILVCATLAGSVTLPPGTLAAWEHYLAVAEECTKAAPTSEFLSLDSHPSQTREVQQGKVIVFQLRPESASAVPHALIHDWLGATFIPDVTIADVFAVTRNYDRYPEWYGPTIVRGHLLERSDCNDRFSIRYVRHVLFVTAVLDSEYDTQYVQVSPTSWYSTSRSTRLQEVDQSDKTADREIDNGTRYVWRAYTLTRYQQRDNGVYIEQESIALSRPIPASLRWIVEPVVKRLARDLLASSLERTRDAVLSARKQQKTRTASSSPA
jgi:hypothetical protein